MSDIVKNLFEKRSRALAEARGMLEAADAEKREFSAEEETKYDRIMEDVAKTDARAKELSEAEGRSKDLDEAVRSYGVKPEESRKVDQLEEFLRGRGARSYEVQLRDLSKTSSSDGSATPTAGGNLVGGRFVPRLYQHLIESSAVLKAGPTILRTATGEEITMPKTTSFSSSSQVNEGAAIPESDPAFGQMVLNSYKYAHSIQVSHELANDTVFDLQGFLAMQSGRSVGNALGTKLVLGTGSDEPKGLVVAATVGKVGAAATPSFDDLIDLQYSVISPYRDRGVFLIRDATAAALRKVKDLNDNYIWQSSVQVGTPDLLLGRPVYTDPNVAATGTAAKSVVFGDMSAYYVRLVENIRFERSDHYAFNTDQVSFRCIVRGDGDLIDASAVKVFQGVAA